MNIEIKNYSEASLKMINKIYAADKELHKLSSEELNEYFTKNWQECDINKTGKIIDKIYNKTNHRYDKPTLAKMLNESNALYKLDNNNFFVNIGAIEDELKISLNNKSELE